MTTPNCSHYARIDTLNLHTALTPRLLQLRDAVKYLFCHRPEVF